MKAVDFGSGTASEGDDFPPGSFRPRHGLSTLPRGERFSAARAQMVLLNPKTSRLRMSKHFERDMQHLHERMLSLFASVEEMLDLASRALLDRTSADRPDASTARLRRMDDDVDAQEVDIEGECLKVLALHQPVASDLRRIAAALKINNDLERIGDLAVNVTERAEAIADFPKFVVPSSLRTLSALSTEMVRSALNAYVDMDVKIARRILTLDEEADRLYVQTVHELQAAMQASAEAIPPGLHCYGASRHIERVADLATNIAEDVIYLVEGEIIRHRHNAYRRKYDASAPA
jgi:phosphate transport system protein